MREAFGWLVTGLSLTPPLIRRKDMSSYVTDKASQRDAPECYQCTGRISTIDTIDDRA